MAKRREVNVDEDLIKSMMEGDIPRLNHIPEEKEDISVYSEMPPVASIEIPEEKQDPEVVQPRIRRRKESKDYASLFLKKGGSAKRQTYISTGIYDKVSKILGIIASEISVPNFIDNVLENHLKEYREEINEL